MKNIQVVDGAMNCSYDIFAIIEEDFNLIFPEDGQDIEFIEDLIERFDGDANLGGLFRELWLRPVKKADVIGIHGTLFYELIWKKKYYPTKRASDIHSRPTSLARSSAERFNMKILLAVAALLIPTFSYAQEPLERKYAVATYFHALDGKDSEAISECVSKRPCEIRSPTFGFKLHLDGVINGTILARVSDAGLDCCCLNDGGPEIPLSLRPRVQHIILSRCRWSSNFHLLNDYTQDNRAKFGDLYLNFSF